MKSLRNYFKDNLTAYSYLFFAQVAAVVVSKYFADVLFYKGFKVTNMTFIDTPILIENIIISLVIPMIFIVGFLVTFKYPKNLADRYGLLSFNLFLAAIVLYSPFAR